MKGTKFTIAYFFLTFFIFDLSHGEKVQVESIEFTSDIHLPFTPNLVEKQLEDKSIANYNTKKKKNLKISISSNPTKYNKKMVKLKIEDKKSPHLYTDKQYVVLKNHNTRIEPSHTIYIKKNIPYLSNNYVYDEGKQNKLNSIMHSFIDKGTTNLFDELFSFYISLIHKIKESLDKAKEIYIAVLSYEDMKIYFENSPTSEKFNINVSPLIIKIKDKVETYMSFCEESKDDIEKKYNKLIELMGNNKELSTFTEMHNQIKSKIIEVETKLNEDFKVIESKNSEVYNILDKLIQETYCVNKDCSSVSFHYEGNVVNQFSALKVDIADCHFNSEKISNFMNYDNKLLKIKYINFCQKKHKLSFSLLMEQIMDIAETHKKYEDIFTKNIGIIKNAMVDLSYVDMDSENIMKTINKFSFACKAVYTVAEWKDTLMTIFDSKKAEMYTLFDKIKEELEHKIFSIVYPGDLEARSEIFSNSQIILGNIDRLIFENCELLEGSLYGYSNPRIYTINNELLKICSQLFTHNMSLKSKLRLVNDQYNLMKHEQSEVDKLRKSIHFIGRNQLENITSDIVDKVRKMENIVTLANDKLEVLNENDQELVSLKEKIDQLIKQFQEKNEEQKELKRQEDEEIEQAATDIKQNLEQIEEKISKLKPFIDLKDNSNEELNIIERVIDISSCNNKDEFTTEKEKIKERMELALKSLLGNGKIEKAYKELPHYISEKKRLNYMLYDLDTVNNILKELKQKCDELDEFINKGTTIVNDEVTIEASNLTQLRNNLIMKSFEDLHNKMNNSYQNFNNTLSSINENIADCEEKRKKIKIYEDDIAERKGEFLDKLIEEGNDSLKGGDTSQVVLALKEVIKENKIFILEKISDGRSIIDTFKGQFELSRKIEKYKSYLQNNQIFDNINSLKASIHEMNADNKLNDCQSRYDSVIYSIDDSIKKVELSKSIIEGVKILNKVINESNKNNESIEHLKGNLKESDEKINKHMVSINEDNLIEDDVKQRLLGELNNEKNKIEDEIRKISALKERSNDLIESSTNFKETVGNSLAEEDTRAHSKDISSKKEKLESITGEISNLTTAITVLSFGVDSLINTQNNEIANLIYNLIIKLEWEIKSKVERSLGILEATKESFEKYKFEKDIKNIFSEENKEALNIISQNIITFKNYINTYMEKYLEIKKKSKNIVDESDNLKKSIENLVDKRSNMKMNNGQMNTILEDFSTWEEELQNLLSNINEKKLEYKKTLVYDSMDRIIYQKRRSDEEIETINLYNEKIDKLKKKITDTTECVLENFNYEDYTNGSRRNQEKIDRLEQEVSILRNEVSNAKREDEIHAIHTNVKQKLREVINEKSKIDDVSKVIKHMEKLLMLTEFSVVMEDIEMNTPKVKEEEGLVKKQFTESEKMKENILRDFENAKKLKDSLINNLDENSIDRCIEEVKVIRENILSNIENINNFLKEAEIHKIASLLYFKNTVRGKEKIEYLKNHDEGEKKEITEQVMENVNRYVRESEDYSNKAAEHAQKTSKNYELSSAYEKKINDLLKEQLILAEKIKVDMKKNDAIYVQIEIEDDYYSNENLLKKLKEKLIRLKQEDSHMKNEDGTNNEKSRDAFTKIEITRANASNVLLNVEKIENRIIDILNEAKIEMEPILMGYKGNYDTLDELKIEKENLKNVSKVLKELEDKRKNFKIELNELGIIETKVNRMENEMNIYKKNYEEGILEEIKKISDQEKKNIELLKESINLITKNAITFLRDSVLGENHITQKFEDPERKLNEIYDSFNKSYKEIEKDALIILESSKTYNDLKEKKEKAKIEKEKLIELNKEVKILLSNINDIKINEVLRLILFMKDKLDNISENADEEYLKLKEHAEDIKRNVQNMINSKSIIAAFNELDNAKHKCSEFKKRKISHSSYKYNAYSIYNEIFKASEFIDIDIETISNLKGHSNINDTEDIVLSIQGDSFDIDSKEKENEENIIKMKSIYEQIKIRDGLKNKIRETANEVDKILLNVQNLLEKYKEIKEVNSDEKEYVEILKSSREYENFIEMTNYYEEKYNKIEIKLKTDSIITELNKYKNSLYILDELIETSNIEEFTANILEKVKGDISTITNKVIDINNNISGINASYYELLELRRKCKLYFLSLIITTINTEISKDVVIIKKEKEYIVACVEYIINNYNRINDDIYTTNKCFSGYHISFYESNNIEDSNKVMEEFKIEEQNVLEKIDDLKRSFLRANERRNSISIDESFQEIKYLYKEFKKKKKHFKNILKKMNEIESKEIENSAKIFANMAESYKNVIENEKEKILYIKDELKEIEYFLNSKAGRLLLIEPIDAIRKTLQHEKIYDIIKHIEIKLNGLENRNDNEDNKLTNHIEQIPYLIERTRFLLKDAELYQKKIDHNLSEEEKMEIVNEVNYHINNAKSWIKKSMDIFDNIQSMIGQGKEFIYENNNTIFSINNIIKKIDQKEKNEKWLIDHIKSHLDEINKVKDKNVLIENNNYDNSQFEQLNQEKYEENNENGGSKFYHLNIKVIIGIIIVFLLFSSGIISVLFKNKNKHINGKSNKNEVYETHEGFNNLYNFDKKEVIVTPFANHEQF
ncbi:reticulocyte binding protein, putative [Plasmodium relictum]|uniref:Reticulocyte binding protein, putative n=1 Tax=Plasmodium relictum TaxID=85471 RepID=A0A1J1HFU6_PLARL|nr:reticulocyte binding protein, putative [Plasmodium relictum]CRH02725.1 reticulocyte binding protein, putative [Plasmodium relictum]